MKRQLGSSEATRLAVSMILAILGGSTVFGAGSGHSQSQGRGMAVRRGEALTEWPPKAKRFALIIGVDQYQDSQITRLEGASNDAKALAAALTAYAGFPSDQVVLLTSDQPQERLPNRGNILRKLSNLRGAVPKDGLLLVAFSGHGIERDRSAYLLPTDAQLSGDVRLLEDTAINVETMRERIRETGVGQVVLLIDACRNDPVSGRSDSDNRMTASYARGFNFDLRNRDVRAFATIYATEVGQRAYEYKEKKLGYFTWGLVEGLKGGAANNKGEVTLAGLVKYLQDVVPKRIGIDLGPGKVQRPSFAIEGYRAEDLVVAVSSSALATNENPGVVNRVDPAAIELSFWETIKNSKDPSDFKAYLQKYPNGTFAELATSRAGLQREPRRNEPPVSTKETPIGNLVIKANNTSRYAGQVDGQNRWDWTIFIDADQDTLSQIRCVEYTLHESFPDPVRTVCTSGTKFALSSNGWGTFTIKIKVILKDGSQRTLSHDLQFQ
jgi:prokaryotic YEATS domain/Caspase domain